ncbi:MAG: V-type ATPase subunit [Anaerolineae bacterium]|nr:V-type ATPase subunit [Anaerolineae bacterium]
MSPSGVTAYARVHATVRALYSYMLTFPMWESLIQAQDFDAVLNLLSKSIYAPYLELDRHLLTPRRVVYQIRRHLADVYEKLIRLTPQPGSQLLQQLWRHYEVDNLKAALRGVETGASWDAVLHLLYPMSKYITVTAEDLERVVRSRDMFQAIESISHTPYYETLVHALSRYRTEKSLFPLEVALDLTYRRSLWASIYELRGADLEHALRMIGTPLDIDNLLWAIRYRVFHHLSEQEIINYTLPMGYKVQDAHIRAIAAGDNLAEIVAHIYPGLEGLERLNLNPREGVAMLEVALQRRFIDLCKSTFIGNPFNIGIPAAYLWLNEHEIRDLTVLVEAKASHTPLDIFLPLLEFYPLLSRSTD